MRHASNKEQSNPKKFSNSRQKTSVTTRTLHALTGKDCSDKFSGVLLSDCISLTREGFIKLHRVLSEHPIKTDGSALLVFIDLLMNAEWKDGKRIFFKKEQISLKRGQLTLGRYQLAKNTGLKPSTAWGALQRLSTKYQITDIQTDTKYSLITILNYNRYQNNEKDTDTHTDSPPTAHRQPTDTLEEVKNLRIKEKELKTGLLNNSEKKIVLNDISSVNHVALSSESAAIRLDEIIGEVAAAKGVKNALALARHKARRQ